MGWDLQKILQTSSTFFQTCALHAAVRLDIFTIIGQQQLANDEIANRLNTSKRGMQMLLDALVAMELLTKESGNYSNTSASKTYLCKNSPHYQGYIIKHHANLFYRWGKLDHAVQTGTSVRKTTADFQHRESFLMGMFNLAMTIAPQIITQIDITDKKQLLDLGGGPGTYAIQFCLHNPQLQATVFDLPSTAPFAHKTIAKFNMQTRIAFYGGDYLQDVIPGQYDVVWISHILHSQNRQQCQLLIDKAVSALTSTGKIFIHDFILEDNGTSPLFPALFALNMLVNSKGGCSYKEQEIRALLSVCGVRNIQRLNFVGPNDSAVIYGEKGA